MADDDPTTVRDLRLMWRSGVAIALVAAACVGSIIYAVVWAVVHDTRLEAVEKWQDKKDKQTAEDARREFWRRDRELHPPAGSR